MTVFDSGIRPAIDDYLLKLSQEKRDYGDYWSASSAGYCMRKVIFERLGIPSTQPEDPRKQRVFTAGHIFHEWIQDITKKAGLSIASEVELQDEDLMIRGHFDDLILIKGLTEADEGYNKSKSGDHLILYDYKTQNSRAFTYQKDRPVSHYHRLQVGTYIYMLRMDADKLLGDKILGKDIEGRLLYISKDDLRMAEKVVMFDKELEAEVKSYWKTLNKYWNEKKIPACTCADYEGGFMAGEKWNPYFYEGEPCSIKWYQQNKEKQDD